MAIYLVEDEIGFDTGLIGYPSLGGCMAVALQTEHGLFGFHDPPGHTARTTKFDEFCRAHTQYGALLNLFGSCKWTDRYAGGSAFTQWVAEMRDIAGKLNFTGVVSGLDITSAATGITNIGAAYVEYVRSITSGAVQIKYAYMAGLDVKKEKDETSGIQKIHPDMSTQAPYLNKVTKDVTGAMGAVDDQTTGGKTATGFYSFRLS